MQKSQLHFNLFVVYKLDGSVSNVKGMLGCKYSYHPENICKPLNENKYTNYSLSEEIFSVQKEHSSLPKKCC